MKFKLSVTESLYSPDSSQVPKLKKLGFTFDGNYLSSDASPEIEFNSLEDLIAFSDEWGELVIFGDTIEIYNGYRE